MTSFTQPGRVQLVILAVLCMIATSPSAPGPLRLAGGAMLVFYLPGAALTLAVLSRTPGLLEGAVLACGLSIAITILIGLALHGLDAMTSGGWAAALCLATLIGCAFSLLRQRTASAPRPAIRIEPIQAGLAGLALLVAAAAVAVARQGALDHQIYAYTEFWMVPTVGTPSVLKLGIRNREKAETVYAVDIVVGGRRLAHWPGIVLPPGETYENTVTTLASQTRGERVEAWLYKGEGRDTVYRKVWSAGEPK